MEEDMVWAWDPTFVPPKPKPVLALDPLGDVETGAHLLSEVFPGTIYFLATWSEVMH